MIELKNISFTYENSREGDSQLRHVDLQVGRGELVILAGRSGCGKTTLTRVLNGLCPQFYPGELTGSYLLDGQDALKMPVHQLGTMVGSVFQDPRSQFFTTNTTDEIVLGMENIPMEQSVMQQRVEAVCSQMNLQRLLDRRIFPLSSGEKQLIAIASVCTMEPKVIVMDEPSAPLTDKETAKLFKTIAKLKSEGVAVIYISHRLEETMQIADRATIMRDGKTITTVNVSDITIDDLIRGMVGHDLKEQFPKRDCPIGEVGFRVEGISREGILNNISFEARKGEVVGICGLVGAGRTETARAIFGIDPKDAGRVFIDGKEAVIRKPLDAINAGIGFVTEDRKTEGLILCRDCKENISIAALRDFVRSGKLNLRREQKSCQDYVEKMHIKTPSLRQKVVNLSGGNQQKIVLAKWLMSDAKVLFLDEPTRGIDIGAKVEVYNIINEIAAAGKCVIVISSEMTELMGICDRIVVMCRGAITGEERKGQFTQESLMYLATGGSAAV